MAASLPSSIASRCNHRASCSCSQATRLFLSDSRVSLIEANDVNRPFRNCTGTGTTVCLFFVVSSSTTQRRQPHSRFRRRRGTGCRIMVHRYRIDGIFELAAMRRVRLCCLRAIGIRILVVRGLRRGRMYKGRSLGVNALVGSARVRGRSPMQA